VEEKLMAPRSSSVPSRVSREFEALRRRLTQWRATRPHLRAAIPEPLWTEAVLLAQQHGVSETARVLGLGYEGLKRRLSQRAMSAVPGPTFVELPLVASSSVVPWVLEFRSPDGRMLRVQVPPMPMADLVVLGRAVWSGA
jgi:hypothetical protein